MKRLFIVLSSIFSSSLLIAQPSKPLITAVQAVAVQAAQTAATHVDPKDETTGVVLANFADIVANFFNIVQQPNDAKNVGTAISHIFSDIVNIALQAFKSGELGMDATPEEITEYACNQSETVRSAIMHITKSKLRTLQHTKGITLS